jgi:translation initiation factor 6 (eIF-6)
MPTRCNTSFFIANLIVCSTCFVHYYAHHQELKSIIQVVAACGIWCFGLQVVGCRLCVQFAGCCYYAHHKELKSIIQVVAAYGTWCFGLQVVG